jgi:hypothetical protein
MAMEKHSSLFLINKFSNIDLPAGAERAEEGEGRVRSWKGRGREGTQRPAV